MQQAIDERRSAHRYPLRFAVEYRIFGRSHSITAGRGEILNMSSRGLLLSLAEGVIKGQLIEISIKWRIYTDQPPTADVLILGRIVRTGSVGTAVRILRYGFFPHRDTILEAAVS